MIQVETATQAERQILTLKGLTDEEENTQRAEIEADRVKAYHRARDAELVLEGGFLFQRCGGGRRIIRRSRRGY